MRSTMHDRLRSTSHDTHLGHLLNTVKHSKGLEPRRRIELHTCVLGQQLRGQAAQSAKHSPTCVDQLSLTVCGEVPTVVTRVLTSEVVRGGSIRDWALPLVALWAIPGSGGVHGHRGRSEHGNVGASHTFHGEWVGDVGGPTLNGTLTSRDGLHVVAEHREYSQTAVLDLLQLQLSESVRVVRQNQRVEGFTRVEEIHINAQRTTLHTVGLKGTHQDKLAGRDSKDGLGVHQVGAAKVAQTALREDMSTSLEPHRPIDLHTSVLGQQLMGQAAQSAQHSPTSVGQLGLMVRGGEGGRVSSQTGGVSTVVSRVLTSEVVRGGGIREWALPLVALRALPGSGGERCHRERSEQGNIGAGHTVHGEWVGDVGGPALNRTFSSRGGLHVVAECKEHSQTAGLDLLHLQLSESVGVASQNQRVEGLTRVEQMQILVQRTTLHTIGLPARMEWACTRLELPR